MGIRGRFIVIAAIGIGSSFIGFLILAALFGKLVGFIGMAVMALTSLATIYIKQKSGLHSKKRYRGLLIYKFLFVR